MISRGIFFTPKGKMYISLAHTDADLDQTLDTIGKVLHGSCVTAGCIP
jgi:glutamate-1-semialdehyde aminotransferase